MVFEVENIKDLKKISECIKNSKKNIIILSGTLGSGKTTLVKEFVKSENIDEDVTSPTFSIQNIYGNKIHHYDLYSKNANEFLALGMLEELEKEGWHFIEWGEELENILKEYGFDVLRINIKISDNKRIVECQD